MKLPGEAAIYHFISGLPRSGSTLMGAILRQNPRFSAGMSSPVASLFEGIIAQVSAGSEISTMVNTAQRGRLLRGLVRRQSQAGVLIWPLTLATAS